MFIDFEKAYDNVPRNKLFNELKLPGGGKRFLQMIMAIYSCTKMIFKSTELLSNRGVKQGAATSSLLFTIYIDRMGKMIKLIVPMMVFLKTFTHYC